MTRALLQQAFDALSAPRNPQSWYARACNDAAVAEKILDELAKPEQAHTEAEVQEIMDRFIQREVGAVSLKVAEDTVRKILGVPAP